MENEEKKIYVSQAVKKRLPRYYRYLRQLLEDGKLRISSLELAALMNVTASQIRQDLNCFGGFGQQGYGYNVKYLFGKISEILGVGERYTAVIIGAGNLGHALAASGTFKDRGVILKALFDISSEKIGKSISGFPVYSLDELDEYCMNERVDIAVLTVPGSAVASVSEKIAATDIKGVWNFSEVELSLPPRLSVENVHLGDKLMNLCYDIKSNQSEEESAGAGQEE